MQIARDLDPLSPVINTYLALAYFFNNQPEGAWRTIRKRWSWIPTSSKPGWTWRMHSLEDPNLKDFYSNLEARRVWPRRAASTSCTLLDTRCKARRPMRSTWFTNGKSPKQGVFVRPTSIAMVYAALGDKEQMYAWLDRAYAQRDGMLAYMTHQGCFRPYMGEPRFLALDQKLGLPPGK